MVNAPAMRPVLIALVVALLLVGGCGGMWTTGSGDPFAPTVEDGDLVFLRTGDRRYYYVIDRKRRMCFFHATLYGKKHLETIECTKLPEFEQFAGKQAPVATQKTAPKVVRKSPRAPSQNTARSPRNGATGEGRAPRYSSREPTVRAEPQNVRGELASQLTDENRLAFRRAYIQQFCAKKRGQDEPLPVILSRFGLDESAWDAAKKEFSSDKDLWEALTAEALESCK